MVMLIEVCYLLNVALKISRLLSYSYVMSQEVGRIWIAFLQSVVAYQTKSACNV